VHQPNPETKKMNKVIIELGDTHIQYFIDGEVPIVGDILNLEGEQPVMVSARKFSFANCYVENGIRIRKPTITLIVKDLY
jgi:hypothetical protein